MKAPAASVFVLLIASAQAGFEQDVRPFLAKYCFECHGESKQKGRVRLDDIPGGEPLDHNLWRRVYEQLSEGEMPPEEAEQPAKDERSSMLAWIAQQSVAPIGHQRRLNRREFSAALQDLTGLPIHFGEALPEDAKVDGFDTGAVALQDAADSVEQWLEVTRRAVDTIRFLEPDKHRRIAIDFREHEFTDFRKWVDKNFKDQGIFTRSKRLKCQPGTGVYLQTQWTGDRGNSFLAVPAPDDHRGTVVVTLGVVGKRPIAGLPVPTLWVKLGGKYIDYVSVDETPQTLTYAIRTEDHLVEDGNVIKLMLQCFVEMPYAIKGFENDDRSKPQDKIPGGIGVYRPKFDRKKLRLPEEQPVPSIVVESISIDYDHRALWPPKAWPVSLGELKDDDASARRLLDLWVERAWRRPVSPDEARQFFTLYQNLRRDGRSFDDALRAVFQSVLMGGSFRFLASPAGDDPGVAQHAMASRLSFMLTGAPPDKDLKKLAAAGQLQDEAILNQQVDRLLNDERSGAFFRPFVIQWLNLEQPITLTMSHLKKQDFRFGRHLKASMKEETIQYIARMFRENRPARELIDSDWTMMNDILAVHYEAEPLDGGHLRPIALTPKATDPRGGGILGHAGIQSMLCWMGDNWVIYRGAWFLHHLLDDPPPPPPLEVPELNPADKGNHGKSFRELLKQHQADPNCSVCHRKIDPMGFAFQNFDISGRWRNEEYHHYVRNEIDGKIEWRGEGATRPVDATGSLPRGEAFSTFQDCKNRLTQYYMKDIMHGLLKKLTLYGTGRKADVGDLVIIHEILQNHQATGYRLGDLTKALVRSEIFQR